MTLTDVPQPLGPLQAVLPCCPVLFAAQVWDLRQTRLVAVGPKPLLLGEYEREQEGMRL